MKRLKGFILAACLILTSTTASAIPIAIEVEGSESSFGAWSLFGPSVFLGDAWGGFGFGGGTYSYSYSGDIAEARYGFLIGGNTGQRGIRWTVTVDGTEAFTGQRGGRFEYFFGGGHFAATAVPEPDALALLAFTLLGIGFMRRRKMI